MSWYNKEKTKLDYDAPIVACNEEFVAVLLPQIKPGNYKIVGYNWFNITTGKYMSCATFPTVKEAVNLYQKTYEVSNADLVITKTFNLENNDDNK